jgi:branched-chain amino acid transport system ATP-binding protein
VATGDEHQASTASILTIDDLEVRYQDVIVGLSGVSLEVPRGSIVAILGANGAGKTTLLRAITGLLPVHRAKITRGRIHLDGQRIDGLSATAIVRSGIAQVMEGRRIFGDLTVDENLRTGGFTVRDKSLTAATHAKVMGLFPTIAERRHQRAGFFSGGEQQMVAIGRALMAQPRLLVLDEPSLGLAPMIVEQIRRIIVDINAEGTSVLLVEQNASMALSIAHHAVVLENGRVARSGSAEELRNDDKIKDLYLGMGTGGRRSYRDAREHHRATVAAAAVPPDAPGANQTGGGS